MEVIADPGFSQFDGTFYLYGTGGRFPVRESAAWNGPYKIGDRGFLLGSQPGDGPRQEGTCAKDGQDYIAYHGYRTQKDGNGTGSRYAYVAKLGWNATTGMPFVQ